MTFRPSRDLSDCSNCLLPAPVFFLWDRAPFCNLFVSLQATVGCTSASLVRAADSFGLS